MAEFKPAYRPYGKARPEGLLRGAQKCPLLIADGVPPS